MQHLRAVGQLDSARGNLPTFYLIILMFGVLSYARGCSCAAAIAFFAFAGLNLWKATSCAWTTPGRPAGSACALFIGLGLAEPVRQLRAGPRQRMRQRRCRCRRTTRPCAG